MAEDTPEVPETPETPETPPAPQGLTQEQVQEMLDAKDAEYQEKISELESKIPTPTTAGTPETFVDAQWQPKDYNELFAKVVDVVDKKFPDMAQKQKDVLYRNVAEKMQDERVLEQTQIDQANKVIDQEIAEIKKTDESVDDKAVFKFIGEWNKGHTTQIASFKDGYELMKQMGNLKKDQSTPRTKTRIIGAPSAGDGGKKKPLHFASPEDALASEIASNLQGDW